MEIVLETNPTIIERVTDYLSMVDKSRTTGFACVRGVLFRRTPDGAIYRFV